MKAPADAHEALRRHGLTLPEAVEEAPWGHCALKIRSKSFFFLNIEGEEEELSLSAAISRWSSISPNRPATASAATAG